MAVTVLLTSGIEFAEHRPNDLWAKGLRAILEIEHMSHSASVGVSQSGKSGGEAIGAAGSAAGSFAGSGLGVGQAAAAGFGVGAGAAGLGFGGSAGSGAGSIGAAGGDVSDNTSIGSFNINS